MSEKKLKKKEVSFKSANGFIRNQGTLQWIYEYCKYNFHHSRIKVHFETTFWDNFSMAFVSAFQNDDFNFLYYLPKNLDNGIKL